MSLPTPNLDDRSFQDLVDDAKRMLHSKWPEWTAWTDHNVSDPGVTLIETFAFMVDQLLYRLNQVPDLTYIKLLELIGLQLQPPTAATAPVTFWLSAPRVTDVNVPQGTEVATERTELSEAVVFRTRAALDILSCRLSAVGSAPSGGSFVDATEALSAGESVPIFSSQPGVGDCFYVGLSEAVSSCIVTVRISGQVEGYGIDPNRPPRVWQGWTGGEWVDCEVISDGTGGFNRAGDVVIHAPDSHRASTLGGRRCGWLRCVIIEPETGAQPYGASPRIEGAEAFTVGGTVEAIHAKEIVSEIVGVSEGSPGQQFVLQHSPVVLTSDPEILEVIVEEDASGHGVERRVEEWRRVDEFTEDQIEMCFVLDPMSGTIYLPPAIREANGRVLSFGSVPPVGAVLRFRSYLTGGGRSGNVASLALHNLRTSLPGISSVENRAAAAGGIDGESIDEAKARGPLLLRTRERAVTAADFEHLTRKAAPEVARVRCSDLQPSEVAAVRVLVVPQIDDGPDGLWRLRAEQLEPSVETLDRIRESLDRRRVVGVRVVIERPTYQGVTVVARVRARRNANIAHVEEQALEALYRYYHPVVGGPDGSGWPFGRPIQAGEAYAVLQSVVGVDIVEESRLYTYDMTSGERATDPVQRIEVDPHGLVFSFNHQVKAQSPR